MAGICFTRNYVIALDSKARLVLPLEIRQAIKVETNGKISISVSLAKGSVPAIVMRLSKASDSDFQNSIPYSRNGRSMQTNARKDMENLESDLV